MSKSKALVLGCCFVLLAGAAWLVIPGGAGGRSLGTAAPLGPLAPAHTEPPPPPPHAYGPPDRHASPDRDADTHPDAYRHAHAHRDADGHVYSSGHAAPHPVTH